MDKKETCKAILALYASLDKTNHQLANTLLSSQGINDRQFLKILGLNKFGIRYFVQFSDSLKHFLLIEQCNKSKLETIKELQVFQKLQFENSNFSKNSILPSLEFAQVLIFRNCKLANLNFIQNMPNLQNLCLDNCQIKDFSGLTGGKQLQYLHILNANFTDMAMLAPLQNLSRLHLDNNAGLKLANINLPNLKYLSLNRNGLTSLKNLPTAANLMAFYASHNRIQNLNGLNKCPNLEYLHLDNNGIVSIDGLECLHKLNSVYFSKNKIRVINPQAIMAAKNFYFDFNPVQKLANMGKFVRCHYIDFSNCLIKDFSPLADIQNLVYLKAKNFSAAAKNSLELLEKDNFILM